MTATTARPRGDWMQTYSGRAFFPLNPDLAAIDLVDIAHALSMLCRYGGHVRRFYSVAEHCVLMSYAVPEEHAPWALLHDSTEAYMQDLIRPIKRQVPAYAEAEDRLMGVICDRFGLAHGMPEEVHEADNRILVNERTALLGPSPMPWLDTENLAPLPVTVEGWAPARAEREYLARCEDLYLDLR